MRTIKLVNFARYPYGRYESDGPYSGEVFRRKVLLPAFEADQDRIQVVLDGASGLGSSFLEEAFGGLVRGGISLNEVRDRLEVVATTDPSLVEEIRDYVSAAANEPDRRRRAHA